MIYKKIAGKDCLKRAEDREESQGFVIIIILLRDYLAV